MARNAKAKLARTQKNYGVDLTNEIDIPTSIESFETRKQYNEWKKNISSFTNRSNQHYQFVKNEHGLVMTRAEYNQVKLNEKRSEQNAKKMKAKIKDRPVYSGGEKQDVTVFQLQSMMKRPDLLGLEGLPKFNFDNIDRPSRLRNKVINFEKRAQPNYFDLRMEQMKINFTVQLRKTFHSDADELIRILEEIPAQDFYEMYMMFDEFNFDYHYTEDADDENAQVNMMLSYIEKYKNGEIDMSLKGF